MMYPSSSILRSLTVPAIGFCQSIQSISIDQNGRDLAGFRDWTLSQRVSTDRPSQCPSDTPAMGCGLQ